MTPDEKLARLEGVMLEAYREELGAAMESPERLSDVYGSDLLKAELRPQLTAIAATAAQSLRAEVAAINILDRDRQINVGWAGGHNDHNRPIDESYCQHVVGRERPFMVTNSETHNLVCTLGNGQTAYLGVPLISRRGNVIGSICVTQPEPREWNAGDVTILVQLAAVVMRLDQSLAAA